MGYFGVFRNHLLSHRHLLSLAHSHPARLTARGAKQSRRIAEEATSRCRHLSASTVSAAAVVSRSKETAAQSAVSIPGVALPKLVTDQAADEDEESLAEGFDSIESALEALSRGQMIVVLDDEKRENEGDLIMAADKVPAASPCLAVSITRFVSSCPDRRQF